MTANRIDLSIAQDFTTTPGPRKRSEGDYSGEEFLELLLVPKFTEALKTNSVLCVNLDGAAGYPTSFLEEAFGGLARQFGSSKVNSNLDIICDDEPYIEDEIRRYISEVK